MSDNITMTGRYQTRDGKDVRIFAMDMGGEYPMLGAVKCSVGWKPYEWTIDGKINAHNKDLDLIPVPRKVRVYGWLNVYPRVGSHYPTFFYERSAADEHANRARIATI